MPQSLAMTKKSRLLKLDDFEDALEWDPEEWERGNRAHFLRHDMDEQVVEEVLFGGWWVKMKVDSAEFAVVGPNWAWNFMWTLLFAPSRMRGDVLRPVTGWDSKLSEIREWERLTGRKWTGSRQKYPD